MQHAAAIPTRRVFSLLAKGYVNIPTRRLTAEEMQGVARERFRDALIAAYGSASAVDQERAFEARQARQKARAVQAQGQVSTRGSIVAPETSAPLASRPQDAVARLEGVERTVPATAGARSSGPAHGDPPTYEMFITDRDLNNRPHRILLRPAKASPTAAGAPPSYEMVVAARDLNNRPHRILLTPLKANPATAGGDPPSYELLVTDRDLNGRPGRVLLRPVQPR